MSQAASTNAPAAMAPVPSPAAKVTLTAPAPTAQTNAAGKVIPPVPDTFNRYGKIWAPSDDIAHPIKLNMQFPGVGDMKIPSQDELNVRDKLEQLALLSDEDIHKQLSAWTPYNKMKLGDQGQFLMRIQAFKDLRSKVALQKAHNMGLLTLTVEQQARFEKDYWNKRLQMERDLSKQFEPIFRAREQKMDDELFREFSSVSQVPQGPKPTGAAAMSTTNKTTPAGSSLPVAQAPR